MLTDSSPIWIANPSIKTVWEIRLRYDGVRTGDHRIFNL